jgi:hypothetical protein
MEITPVAKTTKATTKGSVTLTPSQRLEREYRSEPKAVRFLIRELGKMQVACDRAARQVEDSSDAIEKFFFRREIP